MKVNFQPQIYGSYFYPQCKRKSVPKQQTGSSYAGLKIYQAQEKTSNVYQLSFKANAFKTGLFSSEKMCENSPKYKTAVKRELPSVTDINDTRSEFEKDYDRIMYSDGYDRMRLKSQAAMIFDSDMLEELSDYKICTDDMVTTRMTHVQQVANVAKRISKNLGLNTELTEAIAIGHDIGHTPFGHPGEAVLKKLTTEKGFEPFWHEKNSLRMADYLLTIKNKNGKPKNLNLTYAVRDGIICHCGEVDQNALKPRDEAIDLETVRKASEVQPYTWEGCVVKVSDKIAYLGRDIEDARRTGVLNDEQMEELSQTVKKHVPYFEGEVNNSFLINLFICDIVSNSSPEKGISFSKPVFELMNEIKKFNYKNIYTTDKQKYKPEFYSKVLNTIYDNLEYKYSGKDTIDELQNSDNIYDKDFAKWLDKLSKNTDNLNPNIKIYDLDNKKDYERAIIDYISSMTDTYAIKNYKEIKEQQ